MLYQFKCYKLGEVSICKVINCSKVISCFRVNIEILGTLLRQGTVHNDFGYILYIMNVAKKENVEINEVFLKHLEAFNDKCRERITKVTI